MPLPFTSSFASAAANNSNNDQLTPRPRGDASGDCHTRSGVSENRYSKDQLLDLFRAQAKVGSSSASISDLFVDGWNPASTNGTSNGGWSRKDEFKDGTIGPEICWDYSGNVQPLALVDMTEQEKEAFSGSVNSPIKAPTQGTNKDATPNSSAPGRRTSVNLGQNTNAYSASSPSVRPGNRRRESTEIITSPTSSSRFGKDDNAATPPPSLLRRRTDFRESIHGSGKDEKSEGKEAEGGSPFGTLKRTATGPVSSSLNGPSSPWSAAPQSAGFSPMGAFGNFSLGGSAAQPPTPSDKKPAYGSLRGESRFKGLMGADSSESIGSKVKEKASVNSLERLTESASESAGNTWGAPRSSHEKAIYPNNEEHYPAGSAALGGDDASPPQHIPSRFGEPNRSMSRDEIGFSAFGASSDMGPFRDLLQRRDPPHSQVPHLQAGQGHQTNEPMSPTNTNPYQSPEAEKAIPGDLGEDDFSHQYSHMPPTAAFGYPPRMQTSQHDGPAGEQSRTSSAGASRGFPNLGSLGGLAGLGGSNAWAAPGATGTPSRAAPGASGFADSAFGGLDDLTSPIYGHTAGSGFFGPSSNIGTIGRGSKMGSLFPSAMQDQMRNEQPSSINDLHQRAFSGNDTSGLNQVSRGNDGHSRPARDSLDELLGNMDISSRNGHSIPSPFPNDVTSAATGQSSQAPATSQSSAFAGTPSLTNAANSSYFSKQIDQDSQAANQMPATQQRQMVMPDRMRWIYRDPQGNTQGPWSGLEMHDWYKAGFFSPELQVKKREDTDYEPLAQLIRRIGNSREPFLVPQIGIPHGSVTALASAITQPSGTATTATAPASSAQPPFAGSFPSFGTTLTAEQQNALERRKQEEQYLMARQKEHLAQTQVMMKQQMQHMQGAPHSMHSQQLHHHSSAHSLQSQPSYGSITSPTAYQPSPGQGPIQPPGAMPPFFDSTRSVGSNMLGLGVTTDHLPPVHEDDFSGLVERMNAQRPPPINYTGSSQVSGYQDDSVHQRQVQYMLSERQRQQREQDQLGMFPPSQDEARQAAERLEQFKYLRSQTGDQSASQEVMGPVGSTQRKPESQLQTYPQESDELERQYRTEPAQHVPREPLSLSEQVQKAVKDSPAAVQPQSPWAKLDSVLPQPFPPPQSSSPLPAPAAQRNRQNVADALNAESRSATQTPTVETPNATVAPWAKEINDGIKGPSLKEIQANEARKAAQQEDIALAARRQLAEQERLQLQQQQVAPAPGLPFSAHWANDISPAVPGTSTSAWAKANTSKAAVATPIPNAKKTLAQIQKEEEARKSRAAASAVAASAASNPTNVAASTGGKRYADLASKAPLVNAIQGQGNQAWTTVGAGGKTKIPTGPAPAPPVRSASSSTAQPPAPALSKSKVAVKPVNKQGANEELQRWTRSALSKGLNSSIPVDDFVSQLLLLPAEADIISDSIYSASQTLDGRRFAEEFIRRRKLADKGIIPDSAANGNNATGAFGSSAGGGGSDGKGGSGGGWSEVAKKGGQATTTGEGAKGEAFKVVAGKKKGKR
ncbi:MAG: hypothetical protein Q9220_003831 [cf. Caloplaca sp. 1 TL-2023]